MNIEKRVTLREVAKRAGVTIGTVSNVINNPEVVAESTLQKVNEVIENLNYIPNNNARNMRLKINKTVGLLIPNISNNFYAKIITTLVSCADRDGYTLLILSFEYSPQKEKKALLSLYEKNVQTIIIANGYGDEEELKNYIAKGISIILIDRRTEVKHVSYIEFENSAVVDEAVELLKNKGYKSIGFISEPLNITNIRDRYNSFKKALLKHGYVYNQNHVFISEQLCLNNAENGYLHMKKILEERKREDLPESFMISSDFQAIGVQKAIQEKGYRIPEDFAIIGCDDISMTRFMTPQLTTIHQDRERISLEAWEMVKRIHKGKEVNNKVLSQHLVIREST